MKFKALIFKDRSLGFATIPSFMKTPTECWASSIPTIMSNSTTIDVIANVYPKLDLNNVDLVTLNVTIDELL